MEKGRRLKFDYFLWAWDSVGEGKAESWLVHAQREVWLEKHLVPCLPGDARLLFLEGGEEAGV